MQETTAEESVAPGKRANPFDAGRLVDDSFFVGREKELRQALTYLEQGQNVWIVGGYGSGKSTLLKRIERQMLAPRRLSAKVLIVDLAAADNEAGFLSSLARQLSLPSDVTFEDLRSILLKQRALLMVDEFDLAYQLPGFQLDFPQKLRSLLETTGLQMVVASAQVLTERGITASPLSSRFVTISLVPLSDEDARRFLRRTAKEAGIDLDPSLVDEAVRLATGQPRLLMNIGYALVENDQDWDKALAQFHQMTPPQRLVEKPAPRGLGYSPEAATAMLRADSLRESTQQPFIYTAHLLTALYLAEGDSPAYTSLHTLGIVRNQLLNELLNPQPAQAVVDAILARELGSDSGKAEALLCSQSMEAILARAQERAKGQGASQVSALHLLESLLENRQTEAARWLENALGLER